MTLPSSTSTPSDAQPIQTTDHASGQLSQSTTSPSGASQLAGRKISLQKALRQFPDFPKPGINFVDILPLFANPQLHAELIDALELQILADHATKPDVIVALDARGFLFGPSLALRLGASFVPVRKRGKLPGPTVEAIYEKEYGSDSFEMQQDGVKPGQTVVVVDDIIATGGSAAAAGELVEKLGGKVLGYLFILELDFLHGRDKLGGIVQTLLNATSENL